MLTELKLKKKVSWLHAIHAWLFRQVRLSQSHEKVMLSQVNWHFDSFLMALAACWDSDIRLSVSPKCQHDVTILPRLAALKTAVSFLCSFCCFLLEQRNTHSDFFFSDDSVHPTHSSYRQLALCIGLRCKKQALPCYSFRWQSSGNQCRLCSVKEEKERKYNRGQTTKRLLASAKCFGEEKKKRKMIVVQNPPLIRLHV